MGFFMEHLLGDQLFFNEADDEATDYTADDDNSGGDETDDTSTDYTADGEESDGDNGDDSGEGESGGDEEESTDYTDFGGDDDSGEGGDDEGGSNDSSSGSEGDNEEEVDEIKKKEEELYANLSTDQLDIKHKELKDNFLNLYDTVTELIERIGDTNTAEENIGTVEYIIRTLTDLQKMISDYMNFVYGTKSYIENSINYNRFLATLSGINKILEEMNKKTEDER